MRYSLSLLSSRSAARCSGIAVTAGYAAYQHWPAVVPAWASAGGLLAMLVIGACVGSYPACRAARMPPTDALSTP